MTKKKTAEEVPGAGPQVGAAALGSGGPNPAQPEDLNVPAGGLEKVEAAEALGADPPNPGGTVIGGEGTAAAQIAEAAGGEPIAAEAPHADAAAAGDAVDRGGDTVAEGGGDTAEGSAPTGSGTRSVATQSAGEQAVDAQLEQQFRDAQGTDTGLAEARERISELEEENEDLREENEHLKRSVAAQKGVATRARTSGTDRRRARKVGCMPEVMTEEGRAEFRDAIDQALRAGGATIVASDGEREIVDFEPVAVTGDSWRMHNGRKLFTEPVLLAPGDVSTPVEITGFGLLDEDGDQIAWSPVADPIVVQPNTRVKIENAIAF